MASNESVTATFEVRVATPRMDELRRLSVASGTTSETLTATLLEMDQRLRSLEQARITIGPIRLNEPRYL